MNKIERQNRIKRLIQSGHIGTQEEIKRHLQEEGINVTQATLSRDLREIGLLKLRDASGKLYYSLSETSETTFGARAGFMLVLHTNLGEADVLANLIDSSDIAEILGTVAGADTLLVICKDEETAQAFESDLSTGL